MRRSTICAHPARGRPFPHRIFLLLRCAYWYLPTVSAIRVGCGARDRRDVLALLTGLARTRDDRVATLHRTWQLRRRTAVGPQLVRTARGRGA
jgi:hypothetical protein